MSLKAFHIVFVVFSVLLALGLAGWCFYVDAVDGTATHRGGAIAGMLSAFVLVIYGMWFYRKMKRLGIIR